MDIKEFNSFIKQYPGLDKQHNQADILKIWNKSIDGSSLWIERRKNNKYRALLTGVIIDLLQNKLEQEFGKASIESRGYPYWTLEKSNVERIIELIATLDYQNEKIATLKNASKDKFVAIVNEELSKKLTQITDTEKDSLLVRRIGQNILRELIVDVYNNSCAMCDIDDKKLLRASHIIKWSEDENNRLNPNNVLCLCGLHDLAFENGIIFIDTNYNLIINSKSNKVRSLLRKITFNKLKLPLNKNLYPDKDLLKKRFNSYSNAL